VILWVQVVVCFVALLFCFKASFQTGVMAVSSERLSQAIRGTSNEFTSHEAQVTAADQIADWIRAVLHLQSVAYLLLLFAVVAGLLGLAGLRKTSINSVQPTAGRSAPSGG
jgi:beta-lactamase regulating signal transducer with metallopeptidase domain